MTDAVSETRCWGMPACLEYGPTASGGGGRRPPVGHPMAPRLRRPCWSDGPGSQAPGPLGGSDCRRFGGLCWSGGSACTQLEQGCSRLEGQGPGCGHSVEGRLDRRARFASWKGCLTVGLARFAGCCLEEHLCRWQACLCFPVGRCEAAVTADRWLGKSGD